MQFLLLKTISQFRACAPRRWLLALAGLIVVLPYLFNGPLHAQTLVRHHQLNCSAEFPCPPQIKRRVDFWVEVFSRWDKNQAILHDANSPWRVFEVIDGASSCTKRVAKNKRKRLKANLLALAENLRLDRAPQGKIQSHLARQFERLNSKNVRSSADNLRCQLGVKDQYEPALARFARYSPMTSRIIQEAGMPQELVYLPFVESSYRPDAYSKVGAAGMWQIMPNTARSLGMELNATLDERLDPEAATRAAMRYFKKAKKSLGSAARELKPNIASAELNPFMVTSYNYGVNGMRRAIKQIGPDFYKVLNNYKSANFQVAVKNFYASFLAARHLAIHADTYFPKIKTLTPVNYQTFILQDDVSITRIKRQFNLSSAQLKALNPALTRFVWNNWRLIPAGYRLRLPVDQAGWKKQIAGLRALKPEAQPVNKSIYRVRRGDTACAIASAFKVKCKDLISANNLGRKGKIRVGQRLDIPVRVATASTQVAAAVSTASGLYRVKRGDSACKIAQRFGASCKELIRLNKLGRKGKILVGQKLRIPGVQLAASSSNFVATAKATRYKVRRGDTLCQIAARFDLACSKLRRENKLNKKGLIKVGQMLKIPSGSSLLAASSTSASQLQWANRIDNLGEIKVRTSNGRQSIKVLPNETLGHYSDWLGIRNTSGMRRLNGLSTSSVIGLGEKIIFPRVSSQRIIQFESRRSEYHQVLSEEFKDRFILEGEKTIRVKQGQSLGAIANKHDVPLWLLLRFNPQVGTLRVGQELTVPIINEK